MFFFYFFINLAEYGLLKTNKNKKNLLKYLINKKKHTHTHTQTARNEEYNGIYIYIYISRLRERYQ